MSNDHRHSGGHPAPTRPRKAAPEITIRVSWCKRCGLCVDYCKPGAIALVADLPSVVAAEKCSRCLQCEAICPDFAIQVHDRPAAPGPEGRQGSSTEGREG